jgi:hypothetical protein
MVQKESKESVFQIEKICRRILFGMRVGGMNLLSEFESGKISWQGTFN